MWFNSETTKKQSLALCYKWLHYLQSDQTHSFISQPNRHSDGVLTLAGDCASDPSAEERGKEEGGRNQGISWGELHRATTQKRHCGTDWPIQENIRSRVLHELLPSPKWESRSNISCCSTLTTTVKQSYLWRTLHQPRPRMNSRHKDYMCRLPPFLETTMLT